MLKGFVSGEEKDIKRIPMKGKNLFDVNGQTTLVYSFISLSQDEIVLSRVETGNTSRIYYAAEYPAGTYTINAVASGNVGRIRLYSPVNFNGASYNSFYNGYYKDIPNGGLTATFDEPFSIGIIMGRKDSGSSDGGTVSKIMLNLGSQALPYEPYGYQEGWEVRDNQDRLIWGREDELQTATGTLPFKGYALPVKVKSLLGNAVQNGTPAPDNIVTPEMCGKLVSSDWTIPLTNAGQTIPVYLGEVPTVRRVRKVDLGTLTYTKTGSGNFSATLGDGKVVGNSEIAPAICSHFKVVSANNYSSTPYALCAAINNQSVVSINKTGFEEMTASEFKSAMSGVLLWYALNNEETTISNEPLCKISTYSDELTTIQVHGLSAPLYGIGDYKDTLNLSTGVVTRKVKTLVLTGNEPDIKKYAFQNGDGFQVRNVLDTSYDRANGLCTHYRVSTSGHNNVLWIGVNNAGLFFVGIGTTLGITEVEDFRTWLAQQYSAGHPVTIWYVLSTPTTETVTVPTGMTGEIKGYLTQVSTPTPTNRSVPKWNGVEETGGTYAVTVYTPPEIPTTTGQNTLIVDSNLAPSKLEVSIHAKKIHYGFKIDKSNDDSDSAVIYTHDAVTMTPAAMDFTNDRFDYGSWGNAFFVRDCYPVALNLDGTIAYRLDPDDYTKKTDGTASDIFYELLIEEPSDWSAQWKQYYTKSGDEYILNSQSSAPTFATDTYYKLTYNALFTGNFMMAFPKVWFYRHEDSQYNYIEISNYKLSDDWKCYAHINASAQEVDFIYLPLFKGVIKDSKLRSLPGQIPQGNTTATDEVNAATALGSRWQIWDHSSVECLNDLLVLMSKSIDSQGRFGKGRESGYNLSDTVTYGKLQTGTLIKGGKFHGFSSGYKEVKVFGIEGFWANRWDRLQGMLLVNNVWKIKMTPPYNFTGTDFVTLSNASVPTGNGYLSKVQTSEYGSIPASINGGSSSKYFKDYFYKTATDTRVAIRGGNCGNGANCGFRFVDVSVTASRSYWDLGASPVYK